MYLQIDRRVKLEKKKKNALIALQIFTHREYLQRNSVKGKTREQMHNF